MSEGKFERGEMSMVEWPEGIPDKVKRAIESVDAQHIKSIETETDSEGRVQKITVRREGMTVEQGLSVQEYGATTEYTVEIKDNEPSRMKAHTTYDDTDAGYNAMMMDGSDREVEL